MSTPLPPNTQPPPAPPILRKQELPAAPSGRQVKETLMAQVQFMLDQMFLNHATYPDAIIRVAVDAAWRGIQFQEKGLVLESEIKGPLNEEDQAKVISGEMALEDGAASEVKEINLNPRGKKLQGKNPGRLPGQPIEKESGNVPEQLAQGAETEGRTLVGARKGVGQVPSGAQGVKDGTVSQITVKGDNINNA